MLDQHEADRLMSIEKRKRDDRVWSFPNLGGKVQVPVVSIDGSEDFILDFLRGQIKLSKVTFQERYSVYPLIRLDIDGPDHMNPDGRILPCPHLHRYREGFGASWAESCPELFTNLGNISLTLQQFLEYCHVTDPPRIDVGVV